MAIYSICPPKVIIKAQLIRYNLNDLSQASIDSTLVFTGNNLWVHGGCSDGKFYVLRVSFSKWLALAQTLHMSYGWWFQSCKVKALKHSGAT